MLVRGLYSILHYFDIQAVIPMSSHVTIICVYLKATDVILTMTVEIIVMKKDVVCTTSYYNSNAHGHLGLSQLYMLA